MMNFRSVLLLFLTTLYVSAMAQDKPAYALFTAEGKSLKYKKALKKAQGADVVLFGELHNDAIAHWLELELLIDIVEQKGAKQVVAGGEMFERDQVDGLEAYLEGKIDEKTFRDSVKVWPNYSTDYRPLIEYCKAKGIAYIGTNIPRPFARMVAKEGIEALDVLPADKKSLMTPLPFEIDYTLPSYAAMKEMMGGHGGDLMINQFIAAQAVKDATMAHFILQNRKKNQLFYHVNGAYHSDSKEGIAWYLRQAEPDLNIVNLTVVKQEDLSKLEDEYVGKADIIIVVASRMTVSY